MTFYFVLGFHLLLCSVLVVLVLYQQGKGANAGATIASGSSSTLFGASGPADFVTKLTTALAIGFMFTSILLVRAYLHGGAPKTLGASSPLDGSSIVNEISVEPTTGATSLNGEEFGVIAEPATDLEAGSELVENEIMQVEKSAAPLVQDQAEVSDPTSTEGVDNQPGS